METTSVGEWCHIDTLTPWSRNPRNNAEAIPQVAASIRQHGFPTVITVWAERGVVLAGHTRLAAMRKLLAENAAFALAGSPGPGFVPVRRCSFPSEHAAELFALADNKLGEVAQWDSAQLSTILSDLTSTLGLSALAASGFDADDVLAALDLSSAALDLSSAALSPPVAPPAPAVTPGAAGTATGVTAGTAGEAHADTATGAPVGPAGAPAVTPAVTPTRKADLVVQPPALVLIALLVSRTEQAEVLQLAHKLCAELFPDDTPEAADAMADTPRLSAVILHALRRATA